MRRGEHRLAAFPASAVSSAPLLERADLALYEAKRLGKNGHAGAAPDTGVVT